MCLTFLQVLCSLKLSSRVVWSCKSCKRNLGGGGVTDPDLLYPSLNYRLEPILQYISNLYFQDSCKSCKRYLGGGGVTSLICVFSLHEL